MRCCGAIVVYGTVPWDFGSSSLSLKKGLQEREHTFGIGAKEVGSCLQEQGHDLRLRQRSVRCAVHAEVVPEDRLFLLALDAWEGDDVVVHPEQGDVGCRGRQEQTVRRVQKPRERRVF